MVLVWKERESFKLSAMFISNESRPQHTHRAAFPGAERPKSFTLSVGSLSHPYGISCRRAMDDPLPDHRVRRTRTAWMARAARRTISSVSTGPGQGPVSLEGLVTCCLSPLSLSLSLSGHEPEGGTLNPQGDKVPLALASSQDYAATSLSCSKGS